MMSTAAIVHGASDSLRGEPLMIRWGFESEIMPI